MHHPERLMLRQLWRRFGWLDRVFLAVVVVSLIGWVWRRSEPVSSFPIVLLASLFGWLLYRIPIRQASQLPREVKPEERLKAETDARQTLATILGGVALLAGLYFTASQLRDQRQQASAQLALAGEGQITDQYIRAVEQLGTVDDTHLSARIGAILALERIATTSKKDHGPIMELLASFIRQRSAPVPRPPRLWTPAPEEIQIATKVIGRRQIADSGPARLDLSGAYLAETDLSGAHLEFVLLRGAVLYKANLTDAHLCGADLSDAELSGTNLTRTDLTLTNLTNASVAGLTNRLNNWDPPKWTMKDTKFDGSRLELLKDLPADRMKEFWLALGQVSSVSLTGIPVIAEQLAPELVTKHQARRLLAFEVPIGTLGYDQSAVKQWRADVRRAFVGPFPDACPSEGSAAWLAEAPS
jgi:Pentapeptide repeats (8 copies)